MWPRDEMLLDDRKSENFAIVIKRQLMSKCHKGFSFGRKIFTTDAQHLVILDIR